MASLLTDVPETSTTGKLKEKNKAKKKKKGKKQKKTSEQKEKEKLNGEVLKVVSILVTPDDDLNDAMEQTVLAFSLKQLVEPSPLELLKKVLNELEPKYKISAAKMLNEELSEKSIKNSIKWKSMSQSLIGLDSLRSIPDDCQKALENFLQHQSSKDEAHNSYKTPDLITKEYESALSAFKIAAEEAEAIKSPFNSKFKKLLFAEGMKEVKFDCAVPDSCQSQLNNLNNINVRIQECYDEHMGSIPEEYQDAKLSFKNIIRPLAKPEKEENSDFFWMKLKPLYERILSNKEKKDLGKDITKRNVEIEQAKIDEENEFWLNKYREWEHGRKENGSTEETSTNYWLKVYDEIVSIALNKQEQNQKSNTDDDKYTVAADVSVTQEKKEADWDLHRNFIRLGKTVIEEFPKLFRSVVVNRWNNQYGNIKSIDLNGKTLPTKAYPWPEGMEHVNQNNGDANDNETKKRDVVDGTPTPAQEERGNQLINGGQEILRIQLNEKLSKISCIVGDGDKKDCFTSKNEAFINCLARKLKQIQRKCPNIFTGCEALVLRTTVSDIISRKTIFPFKFKQELLFENEIGKTLKGLVKDSTLEVDLVYTIRGPSWSSLKKACGSHNEHLFKNGQIELMDTTCLNGILRGKHKLLDDDSELYRAREYDRKGWECTTMKEYVKKIHDWRRSDEKLEDDFFRRLTSAEHIDELKNMRNQRLAHRAIVKVSSKEWNYLLEKTRFHIEHIERCKFISEYMKQLLLEKLDELNDDDYLINESLLQMEEKADTFEKKYEEIHLNLEKISKEINDAKDEIITTISTNINTNTTRVLNRTNHIAAQNTAQNNQIIDLLLNQQKAPSLSNTADDDTYVVFLSHKQKDKDPQYGIRMQDLAGRMYENLRGRRRLSFLDKNYNGDSWDDLPNLVAQSKTVVVLLSEKFVESPWCVLELLSAIMHKRPIVFFRISDTFKLAALKKQLIVIGFPFPNALNKFSVEINYNEDYFDAHMNRIVERVEKNDKAYPLSVDVVVTREEVVEQYKLLRDARNEKFPCKRSWPLWGAADFDEESEYGSTGETKTTQQSNKPLGKVPALPKLLSIDVHVEHLNQVVQMLLDDEDKSSNHLGFVGIKAMGGQGKSVMMCRLAHDPAVLARFSGGVVWINVGDGVDSMNPLLSQIASERAFKIKPDKEYTEEQCNDAIVVQLGNMKNGSDILLLLDNIWEDSLDAVQEFLNVCPKDVRVVMTSRDSSAVFELGGTAIDLSELSLEAAVNMLHEQCGNKVTLANDVANALATACGRHVLAICHIGTQLQKYKHKNPESILEKIQDTKRELSERFQTRGRRRTDNEMDVFACLALSFDMLDKTSQKKERKLALGLSLFPSEKSIPSGALLRLCDFRNLGEARDIVAELEMRSIVSSFTEGVVVTLHGFMHEVLTEKRLNGGDMVEVFGTTVVDTALNYFNAFHHVCDGSRFDSLKIAMEKYGNELGDEEEIVSAAVQVNGAALKFCSERLRGEEKMVRTAMESFGYGRLEGMLQFGDNVTAMVDRILREDLKENEEKLGPDHEDTLESVNNLGVLLKDRGQLDEAESLWRRALDGRERTLGPDHPLTLLSVNNLGLLLKTRGKLDEAEPLYRRALERQERTLVPDHDHSATLLSVNNLGVLLYARGQLDEAEPLLRRALEGYERTLGPDHSDTLTSFNSLGRLLQARGQLDEAEPLFRRALEGKERTLGPDHKHTLTLVNNLGTLLQARGQLNEAETLFRRALKANERTVGPDHKDTLSSANNLGALLFNCARFEEADKILRPNLERFVKTFGPSHPNTLNVVKVLDFLKKKNSRHKKKQKPNDKCACGSNKKYKKCCKNI